MIRLPPKIKTSSTQKLFWKSYAFKVTLASKRSSKRATWSKHPFIVLAADSPLTMDNIFNEDVRVQYGWRQCTIYLKSAEPTQLLIDHLNIKHFKLVEVTFPESAAALALLNQDHKVVLRDTLFFKYFRWRIVFKPMDLTLRRELHEWVYGYFEPNDVGERFSLTEGAHNYVLYLRDEDDVIVTKLTQPCIGKVEKVVLTNNNTQGTNETRTLSQTD